MRARNYFWPKHTPHREDEVPRARQRLEDKIFRFDKELCHTFDAVQRREYQISKTLRSTPTKTDSILKPGIPHGLSDLGKGDGDVHHASTMYLGEVKKRVWGCTDVLHLTY